MTIGQSAFVQGYLPIALLVNAIKNKKPLRPGFYDSGAQIVTADSVDMGNGLPAISFDEAMQMAGDPAATATYYKPWTETVTADSSTPPAADRRRVGVTSGGGPDCGRAAARPPFVLNHDRLAAAWSPCAISPSATAAWLRWTT